MELTKEIIYDKNLIQDESVKITYSGNLFKNGSHEVYIVYGFDKDWKNTTYQKMDKTENGFSTSIKLLEYTEFNFCFKDSNDVWDNNNNSDYTLKIEIKKDSTSDLNALLDDILNEVKTPENKKSDLEDSIAKIQKIAEDFDKIFEDIEDTTTTSDIYTVSSLTDEQIHNIAMSFDSLLDKIEFEQTLCITDEEICNIRKKFDLLLDKFEIEHTISNISTAESLDLKETFPEEFDFCVDTGNVQKSEIKQEVSSTNTTVETSEVSSVKSSEITTVSTKSTTASENSNLSLITTSKHKNIFDFDNLSPWYVLKKRIRLAFYKLIYVLPAFLFGEEDDSEN